MSEETKWLGLWKSRYACPKFVALDWNYEAKKGPRRKELLAKHKELRAWNNYEPDAKGAKSRELEGSEREVWIASLPINPEMLPDPSWQQRLSQRGRGNGKGRLDRSEAVPKPGPIQKVEEAIKSTVGSQNNQPTITAEPAKQAAPTTRPQEEAQAAGKTRAQLERERDEKFKVMASGLPDESMRQNLRRVLAAQWAKEDAAQGISPVPKAAKLDHLTTASSSRVDPSSQPLEPPAQPAPIAQPMPIEKPVPIAQPAVITQTAPAVTTAPMAQAEKRIEAPRSVPKPTGARLGSGLNASEWVKDNVASKGSEDESSPTAPAAPAAQTHRQSQQQADHQESGKHQGLFQLEKPREQQEPQKDEAAAPEKQQGILAEPTQKTGPVAKIKSLVKSALPGKQKSSLFVGSPDSARRKNSVSFQDLPATATIEPSQNGTYNPGESSAALGENRFLRGHSSSQHEDNDAVEAYQPNWNSVQPLLETAPTWPLPNASTKSKSRDAVDDKEDEAAPSGSSLPQGQTDLQQINRYLQQQLRKDTLAVEQLKEQLQRQDERVKQLLEEQDLQRKHVLGLNVELRLQQESSQDLIAEGTRVAEDRDRAMNELQRQQDMVQQLSATVVEEEEKVADLRTDARRQKLNAVRVSRRQEPMADDEIVLHIKSLHYNLLTFSVQQLDALGRKSEASFDISTLPDSTKEWTNNYISLSTDTTIIPPNRLRPYIFISILCKTLCEAFKAHYYFGTSDVSPIKSAVSMAKALRPERDYKTRQWFDVVWKLIDQQDGEVLPQAEQALLREMVDNVKADFGSTLSVSWNTEMEEKLATIFKPAMNLFRVLHRQDARYFVDMAPAKGWTFSAAQMEEVVDLEEEPAALKGCAIEVSVFPAVYKRGGMRGEDEHVTAVVSKARVVTKGKTAMEKAGEV